MHVFFLSELNLSPMRLENVALKITCMSFKANCL